MKMRAAVLEGGAPSPPGAAGTGNTRSPPHPDPRAHAVRPYNAMPIRPAPGGAGAPPSSQSTPILIALRTGATQRDSGDNLRRGHEWSFPFSWVFG